MAVLTMLLAILFSGVASNSASTLFDIIKHAKRNYDDCDYLALALQHWLNVKPSGETHETIYTERRWLVSYHFTEVLQMDITNFEELRLLSCQLIAANNPDEIRDILQISEEVLDDITSDIESFLLNIGDGNDAMQWLDTMRYWIESFQRFGYSQNSLLTATEEHVEEFLVELLAKFAQHPSHHEFQKQITTNNVNISALADVLTGTLSIEEAALLYDVDVNKLGAAIDNLKQFPKLVLRVGWEELEADIKLYEALWKTGIVDTLTSTSISSDM